MRRLEPGDRLFAPGDPSDSLFIVLSGTVALFAVLRGDEQATLIREVGRGESLGEEAVLSGVRRSAEALCTVRASVAEMPVHLLRRVQTRAGNEQALDRELRLLKREATRGALRAQAFARHLGADDFELLLDAVSFRNYESSEFVFRQGEAADRCLLVHHGLVQIQSECEGRVRVHGYLSRGDFFGDEELFSGSGYRYSAVALGETVCMHPNAEVMRSLADRNPGLARRLRRMSVARHAGLVVLASEALGSTEHVLKDAYKMNMARSLLAIDQERCVRCGHCAWACAEVHDGVSRLIRSGDKVVTQQQESGLSSLLLPNTCQHCEQPACMIDCPTGAIGRDPEGEVFIREALCTGCGACAKACPWHNIQLGPRGHGSRSSSTAERADHRKSSDWVAVKCDLCREYEAPACVQACPTDAVQRLDPSQDFETVRAMFGGHSAPASSEPRVAGHAWRGIPLPLVSALAMVLLAVFALPARAVPGAGFWSGIVAGLGCLVLMLHGFVKRGIRFWIRRRGKRGLRGQSTRSATSSVSPWFYAHQSVGLVTIGSLTWHAGLEGAHGWAGLLLGVFALSAISGVFGAVTYIWIPRRLTRLERRGALPEDFADERTSLSDELYRRTSGQNSLMKKIAERMLLPYSKSALASVALLLSGRDLRAERARLRARVETRLAGRGGGRLAGLDDLIKVVVDLRALPLRRLLTGLLRCWQPWHAGLTLALLALLILHVWSEVG